MCQLFLKRLIYRLDVFRFLCGSSLDSLLSFVVSGCVSYQVRTGTATAHSLGFEFSTFLSCFISTVCLLCLFIIMKEDRANTGTNQGKFVAAVGSLQKGNNYARSVNVAKDPRCVAK